MNVGTASTLVILVLLFPLIGSALNGFLGPVLGRRFVNIAGTVSIFAAFVVACLVLANVVGAPAGHASITVRLWQWIDLGGGTNLSVGMDFTLDALSALMLMVITGVGFLIHVYSVGYMEHDTGFARFFSYMNFFIFSMLTLVLAADLVILIIGWALVALSSYLLIGFWHDRPSAVLAARKAFITQVIGDVALVIAAFLIVLNTHTLSLPNIFARTQAFPAGGALITGICVLLAIGAFAKSAQFPLHTWLPGRDGRPDAGVGAHPRGHDGHRGRVPDRAFPRALQPRAGRRGDGRLRRHGHRGDGGHHRALADRHQTCDRVLDDVADRADDLRGRASARTAPGMFHFATHAVFKALLFMAAGNVIHALHDEQDIRLMGGLHARMKWTASCVRRRVTRARRVLPLLGVVQQGGPARASAPSPVPGMFPWMLYIVGVGVNVLTGLYAFRLYFTVFQGEPQTARVFAVKEAGNAMLIPVVILGVLAVVVAWPLEFPLPNTLHVFSDFLSPVFAGSQSQLFHAPGLGLAARRADHRHGREPHRHRARACASGTSTSPDAQVVLARLPRVHPAALVQQVLLRRDLRSRAGAPDEGRCTHRAPRGRARRHGRLGRRRRRPAARASASTCARFRPG